MDTLDRYFCRKVKKRSGVHSRITAKTGGPGGCKNPAVSINGENIDLYLKKRIIIIARTWSDKDEVLPTLPMEITYSRWFNGSVGIERGPLVYALKIQENWQEMTDARQNDTYWEVRPGSPWNYSLISEEIRNMNYQVGIKDMIADYPWNPENAPISIKTAGIRAPGWTIQNGSASMLLSMGRPVTQEISSILPEAIELIPYGCTTLRISQFPVLK